MMQDGSGSLQLLNPIVLPEPVGLLPLAPGWLVLLLLLGLGLFHLGWRRWLRWRANRYRREALRELAALQDPAMLPALLKRAALSTFDRTRVASLSGPAWHRFLDQSAAMTAFCTGMGEHLDRLSFGDAELSEAELTQLRLAITQWLRHHEGRR